MCEAVLKERTFPFFYLLLHHLQFSLQNKGFEGTGAFFTFLTLLKIKISVIFDFGAQNIRVDLPIKDVL